MSDRFDIRATINHIIARTCDKHIITRTTRKAVRTRTASQGIVSSPSGQRHRPGKTTGIHRVIAVTTGQIRHLNAVECIGSFTSHAGVSQGLIRIGRLNDLVGSSYFHHIGRRCLVGTGRHSISRNIIGRGHRGKTGPGDDCRQCHGTGSCIRRGYQCSNRYFGIDRCHQIGSGCRQIRIEGFRSQHITVYRDRPCIGSHSRSKGNRIYLGDRFGLGTTIDHIIARTPVYYIIACTSGKTVTGCTAGQRIVTRTSSQCDRTQRKGAGIDRVISISASKVGTFNTGKCIRPLTAKTGIR